MNNRFYPAVRFGCKNDLKGVVLFAGIVLLINVAFQVLIPALQGDRFGTFTGIGALGGFFFLVQGIAGFREKLRIFLQNGVSRRTGFLADITTLAIASAALAVVGEVIMGLVQVLNRGSEGMYAGDLYQLIYREFEALEVLTLGQHVASGLFNFTLFLAVALFGEWFSVLFWRLSKFWTIAAGVLFVVGCNVVPYGLYQLSGSVPVIARAWESLVIFVLLSPWNAMLVFLLIAMFFAGFNWLLFRNTYLKGIS